MKPENNSFCEECGCCLDCYGNKKCPSSRDGKHVYPKGYFYEPCMINRPKMIQFRSISRLIKCPIDGIEIGPKDCWGCPHNKGFYTAALENKKQGEFHNDHSNFVKCSYKEKK